MHMDLNQLVVVVVVVVGVVDTPLRYMERGPAQQEALSEAEYWAFFAFLSLLQMLLIIWLKDLIFAIYKVLQPTHTRMEDHRSSGEED